MLGTDAHGARGRHLPPNRRPHDLGPQHRRAGREVLAQRYSESGLPTDPDQIVVTSGAMGAISLLARTLIAPGQRVVVEGVSYPHAHDSFVAGIRSHYRWLKRLGQPDAIPVPQTVTA